MAFTFFGGYKCFQLRHKKDLLWFPLQCHTVTLPSSREQNPVDRNNYHTHRRPQPSRPSQSCYSVPSTAITVPGHKESEPVSLVASSVATKNSANSYHRLLTTPEGVNIDVVGNGTVVKQDENE